MRSPFLLLAAVSLSACGYGAASLEFLEVIPAQPRIGEVVTVRFRVLDYRGEPQAGAPVDFKIQGDKVDGVSLSPTQVQSLKGTGYAETQLVVSTRVTSLIITAKSGDKTVSTPSISVAGSVANGRQFTFQCGSIAGDASGGIHAIGAYDSSRHLIAGVKLDCIAHVGDRSGDGVPGALVSFLTEAGTIGPTEASVADVVGNAKILYKSSLPFPKATDPGVFTWAPPKDATHTGTLLAPQWMEPYRWIAKPTDLTPPASSNQPEPRRVDPVRKDSSNKDIVNNPRDNLVSMIAVVSGEEGFLDANNNGKFDDGEPFDDLPEPFVDADDNGTWDPDERFVDANANGKWDAANGKWDANALIWVSERIIWTGWPDPLDTVGPDSLIRIFVPSNGIAVVPTFGGYYSPITVGFTDPWFNSIAQNDINDGCSIAANEFIEIQPKVAHQGIAFTYPSLTVFSLGVQDIRKAEVNSMGMPVAQPARSILAEIGCKLTASPLDGHKILIALPNIQVDLKAYP